MLFTCDLLNYYFYCIQFLWLLITEKISTNNYNIQPNINNNTYKKHFHLKSSKFLIGPYNFVKFIIKCILSWVKQVIVCMKFKLIIKLNKWTEVRLAKVAILLHWSFLISNYTLPEYENVIVRHGESQPRSIILFALLHNYRGSKNTFKQKYLFFVTLKWCTVVLLFLSGHFKRGTNNFYFEGSLL